LIVSLKPKSVSKPYWSVFDLGKKETELAALEVEAGAPDLWSNPQKAQQLMKRISSLRDEIETWCGLEKRLADALELAQLQDASLQAELETETTTLEHEVDQRELRTLLSGEYDAGDALLSINAGAGGTEACDWANMLLRMYQRWCEGRGWEIEVTDALPGESAGIKSATVLVTGENAYGFCKAERGVHRLVRI